MEELEQNYRGSHRDIDITLKFSTDENLPQQVLGDDVRLHQVLTNLINNSIKFTQQGSVSTSVNLQSLEGNGVKVCFQVKDTGRGMTPKQAASVFEEYQQNELDDNRIHKGAGLGLAIVKRLVTAMNGSISVESTEGKGTTFSLEIPFHIAPALLAQESLAIVPNQNYIKGSRILVADDNYMNLSIVAHILKKEEAKFELVKDGLEALKAMQSRSFDLILLDINMPNLSGAELIKQREAYKEQNSSTAMLALTGNTSPEDIRGYREIGFTDVIPKPFTSQALTDILNKNLASSKA
jgi:CheY-like chemotaxis protein/anti-sigma regulatory factor (Ser/Thr protein kinase)